MKKHVISTRVTIDEEKHLNSMAADMLGEGSNWRDLLRAIETEKLRLFDPRKRKAYISFRFPPKWWVAGMDAADLAARLRIKPEDLPDMGFAIEDGKAFAPWKAWRAKSAKPAFDPTTPPVWWEPLEDYPNAMNLRTAIKASKLKRADFIEAGMRIADDKILGGLPGWIESE